jgi:uncharacterized damage-inducible protein DinB
LPIELREYDPNWPGAHERSRRELLAIHGSQLDDALVTFAGALTESDLAKQILLPNESATLWVLLDHLFHHQTHHRGQITTLLTQAGVSYGSVENPMAVYIDGQGAA